MDLFHEGEVDIFQGDILSIWRGKSSSLPCIFSIHVFLVPDHLAWVDLLTRAFTAELS